MLEALSHALTLLISADPAVLDALWRSFFVTGTAVVIAVIIGFPCGAILALFNFHGRQVWMIAVNAMMGLPPVVAGLIVYLFFSGSGPFGVLGIIYTPVAMIIAQVIIITPFVTAITRQILADLWHYYAEHILSFGVGPVRRVLTMLFEARRSLLIAGLTGFGRGIAEVGAVMIVGGNIDHATRVMTTAISLETSKGNMALAVALGIVLMLFVVAINTIIFIVGQTKVSTHHDH